MFKGYKTFFFILVCAVIILAAVSCETPVRQTDDISDYSGDASLSEDDNADEKDAQNPDGEEAPQKAVSPGFDIDVFDKAEPLQTIDKEIYVSDYEGDKPTLQEFTLYYYQDSADFTELFPDAGFEKWEVEVKPEYGELIFRAVYKNYIYMQLQDENGLDILYRHNLETGTDETVFTYDGPNSVYIHTVNDKYVIWMEDENANWLKASLNCYDIEKGTNTKVFTYTRQEGSDYMYSWNFDEVVLVGDCLYFDNVPRKADGVTDMDMYVYDIEKNELTMIAQGRATEPIPFDGVSWLGFDEASKQYMLRNRDSSKDIPLGQEYFKMYASENIAVGVNSGNIKGIMYFDGENSYPILKSTEHIETVSLSGDDYIGWDGWNNGDALFFDVNNQLIVNVDCLEKGKRYIGRFGDEYLVFECSEFEPDPEIEDLTRIKTKIFYYVKKSDLVKSE